MQTKTIQLSQYRAGYVEAGRGPTLLFLHGFLGSAMVWDPLLAALRDRFRCVALDLLGFGASSQPDLRYTIHHQVAFVREAIAALDLGTVTLVGHSYGGWAAAAYAIAAATGEAPPLRSLVLVAPAGIRDDSFVGRYTHLRPLLWETPLVDATLAALLPIAALMGQRQALAQIRRTRATLRAQPVAKSFLRDRLRPEDAIDTVENDIHRIAVPTLILSGDRDTTIPLWHCQTYADRIPAATLRVLPAGHDLISTHHHDLAGAIAGFCT